MRIMRVLALITAGIGLPAVAQQQQMPQTTHPVQTIGDARRGEALAKRWCVTCHLPDSNGALNDATPPLHWIVEQVQKDPNFIRGFLNHPHAPMPPLDLGRTEIEDFVAYFRELAKH